MFFDDERSELALIPQYLRRGPRRMRRKSDKVPVIVDEIQDGDVLMINYGHGFAEHQMYKVGDYVIDAGRGKWLSPSINEYEEIPVEEEFIVFPTMRFMDGLQEYIVVAPYGDSGVAWGCVPVDWSGKCLSEQRYHVWVREDIFNCLRNKS